MTISQIAKKVKIIFTRKITYIFLIFFIATIIVINRVLYLSEGPVGEKNCPPLFPDQDTAN